MPQTATATVEARQRTEVPDERPLRRDRRVWILALLAVYFGVLLAGAGSSGEELAESWRRLGVPAATPVFLDVRIVLGALESTRQGLDPMADNAFDPLGRPVNYPRAWLLLRHTGLGPGDAVGVGLAMAAAYLVASFRIMRVRLPWETVVYGVVYVSPPFMMAIERANIDLILFVLVAIGLALYRRYGASAALPVVFLAGMLKLYPIVALVMFVRERMRSFLRILFVAGLAFTIYLLAILPELETIAAITERSELHSYGRPVLFEMFDRFLAGLGWRGLPGTALELVPWIALGGIALRLLATRRRYKISGPHESIDAFRVGAAVYWISFIAGSNWDYRLIFLAFTLPQLLAWVADPHAGKWARWALAATLTLLLCPFVAWTIPWPTLFIEESASWVLLFLFGRLLLATRPRWSRLPLVFGIRNA